jgi:NADH dehydrogenase FAD-containing subunit
MKKKVVITGAGYAGIFVAAHLCKENKHFDVSLIDKNPHLQLLQQITGIASTSCQFCEASFNRGTQLSLHYKEKHLSTRYTMKKIK